MTAGSQPPDPRRTGKRSDAMTSALVNLTLPVLNEEAQLAASVDQIRRFLVEHAMTNVEIVIADNGSTDRTLEIADELAARYPEVQAVQLEEQGRGRALKQV